MMTRPMQQPTHGRTAGRVRGPVLDGPGIIVDGVYIAWVDMASATGMSIRTCKRGFQEALDIGVIGPLEIKPVAHA